jgi:hypothetical protein
MVVPGRSSDSRDARKLKRRNAAAAALLRKWMADESGYDEENRPEVAAGWEAARAGFRMSDTDE